MSLNHRINQLEKKKGSCSFMLVIVEEGEDSASTIEQHLQEAGVKREAVGHMLVIHKDLRPQDDHHDG